MKNNKKMVFIVILNILIIGLICAFININKNVTKEKQVIKEMSESTQISNLQTQINTLNKEHTDYANYIQTCKNRIATALTNEKVATSANDTLETMSTNVGKVLQARTADATATADNITEGKTAYVNGKLIIGTGADNKSHYEEGKSTSTGTIILYFGGKEILASEKVYGSTSVGGTWANCAYGPYTVIDSIDPKIFATVRCKGAFWGGSASGNSPGVGIDGGRATLSFIDTVTSETVYTRNVSGRPYDVTIDLASLNLKNPIKLQYQSWGHMSTWGDPTGQAYLKEVYLKVRNDYQG